MSRIEARSAAGYLAAAVPSARLGMELAAEADRIAADPAFVDRRLLLEVNR